MQGYFCRIFGAHKYLGNPEWKEAAKSAENTLAWYLLKHISPKGYTDSQGAIFRIMGTAIFLLLNALTDKKKSCCKARRG